MKTKPKNAAGKRNHTRIAFEIRNALLIRFKDLSDIGSLLSVFNDAEIASLAERAMSAIMHCEKIMISLKRSK
jgi:hypothetical protein